MSFGKVASLTAKKGIIVVDDDQSVRDTLKDCLSAEGYDVITSGNGADAIKKFKKKFFNVAILDLKLPDIDGLQLLTQIHEENPKTLNIMLTGYPTLNNAVNSLNLGAVAYVMKPLNPDELLFYIKTKLVEIDRDEKSTSLLDDSLPAFFELLSDGQWWSIDTLAERLKLPQTIVEKMCSFCAHSELVNYWSKNNLVKLEKPRNTPKKT